MTIAIKISNTSTDKIATVKDLNRIARNGGGFVETVALSQELLPGETVIKHVWQGRHIEISTD